MTYINDYLKKYRNITFAEEKINDIDIALFTQLTYIDYLVGFNATFDEYLQKSLENKDLLKHHLQKKEIIESIKLVIDSNRYKDILIKNSTYILKKDEQFGAFTLILPDKTKIICFTL